MGKHEGLTVEECLSHIPHTLAAGLGQTPAIGGMRILNDAGHWLYTVHHWFHALRPRVTLDFVKDQGYVWLPPDFRDLVAWDVSQGLTTRFEMTTAGEVLERRTKSLVKSSWITHGTIVHAPRFQYATGTLTVAAAPTDTDTVTISDGVRSLIFEWDSTGAVTAGNIAITFVAADTATTAAVLLKDAILAQNNTANAFKMDAVVDATSTTVVNLKSRTEGTAGNVTITETGATITAVGMIGGLNGGPMRPRIDLWPDPSVDLEAALSIYYRGDWEPLDEDDHFISTTAWLEGIYLQAVRAVTRGYEREDMASMSTRLGEIYASPWMQSAIQRDDEMQPDMGPMRGGAVEISRAPTTPTWNFTGVNGPS